MAQTISKHIGEGFGKGEVAAALAYDPADTFGGMKIKSIMHNEDEKAYFRDSGAYIYASSSGVLEITATTINLNGAFAFTGTDKLALGTNAAKLTLTEGLPVLQVYTTCASTDGATTANPVYISATMSGTGGVGRALEAMLTVSGKLGTYGNALKGYTVLTGGTGSTGLISAVCAEMLMSGGATLGTFGVLELELVCPASWTAGQGTNGANCISLIYAQASNASGSTTLTEFDTYGYLLNLQGLTDDTGHLYYDDTLRIVIGSTVKYIPLSSATASFTTAYLIQSSLATDTESAITGAVIIAGGVGIAKALWVGTTSRLVGAVTASSTLAVAGQLNADATTASNGVTAGAFVCDGGAGIAKELYVGLTSNLAGAITAGSTLGIAGLVTSTSVTGFRSNATFLPDTTYTNYAFSVGNKVAELTVNFLQTTGQNFNPIQAIVDCTATGTGPTDSSQVNLFFAKLTHDTNAMTNLRLKCADFTTEVGVNVLDAYVYQGEIDLTGDVAIGGELCALGLVVNVGTGTVTGAVRGQVIAMSGSAMPANSIGLFINTGSSAVLTHAVYIETQNGTTITNGIHLANAGTFTNLIDAGGTITNFLNLSGAEFRAEIVYL